MWSNLDDLWIFGLSSVVMLSGAEVSLILSTPLTAPPPTDTSATQRSKAIRRLDVGSASGSDHYTVAHKVGILLLFIYTSVVTTLINKVIINFRAYLHYTHTHTL